MSKFVKLNIEAAGGTPQPVIINTRRVLKVTLAAPRSTSGKVQCIIEFINGQPLTVIGDLDAVVGALESPL
jgi:hypothetical protein